MTDMKVLYKEYDGSTLIDGYNLGEHGVRLYVDTERVGFVPYEELRCIVPTDD